MLDGNGGFCAVLEGFCELGEQKDFARQKTERERALEVQFSGGILEFGEFCRVVES